ncbi:MAG TPA: hypothetical protein VGC41_02940, partial [Kofleriaceae bacterium]
MNDGRPIPLFAVLQAQARPLGHALELKATEPPAQSWLPIAPQPAASQPGVADEISVEDLSQQKNDEELAQLRSLAIEEGRAAGLEETAKLRAQLASLAAELVAARQSNVTKQAETIAACAIAAITGFVETAPKQELFTPVVEAWIARAGGDKAVAKCHPSDVVALQTAIGDAPILVEADAAMKPGDLAIRGAALDLRHSFAERLRDLRDV